uniref:Immunoglobulin V-set domain-containing protein n=1 Tax=Meleagris gallopavo TaxID=9103 RepID=A0A803XNB5_MELGA
MGLYRSLCISMGPYGSLWVCMGSLWILHYTPEEGAWVAPGPFQGVLSWNGSHGTRDIQDLSVRLSAVGRPHAGLYVCRLRRNLTFEGYTYSLARNKSVKLAVVESGTVPLRELGGEGGRYCAFKRVVLEVGGEGGRYCAFKRVVLCL